MADVLIRGMEMPKNCGTCKFAGVCDVLPASEWPDIESIILNDAIGVDGARHKDCPLVEVPPHGRLIDADLLLSVIKKERDRIADTYGKNDEYVRCLEKYAMNIVSEAPTVIPASEVKNNG